MPRSDILLRVDYAPKDWAEEQLFMLRPNYPDWDLWIVRCYPNYIRWCAKPRGAEVATVRTASPEELVAAIAAAAAESDPGEAETRAPGGRAPGARLCLVKDF